MALKTGISERRFVEFNVDSTGKINVDNYKYVLPDPTLEYKANKLLNQKKEIVKHSMLTSSEKEYIIHL
ncbi:MAG: type II toxin-antitoxin system RnlB family antitoxin [Erysipelotrichaceae bacterium]|nr:type II toxin-antitoxin system RnlB family antitoxin [Erysipelotrichaceae bacterium]